MRAKGRVEKGKKTGIIISGERGNLGLFEDGGF
jgi:hypothetical protein